jgi:hypothetical protein
LPTGGSDEAHAGGYQIRENVAAVVFDHRPDRHRQLQGLAQRPGTVVPHAEPAVAGVAVG